MTLADFDSYVKAQELVGNTYKDKYKFMDMSLTNIMYKNSCVQVDAAIRYLSFLVDVLTYRQAIQTLC